MLLYLCVKIHIIMKIFAKRFDFKIRIVPASLLVKINYKYFDVSYNVRFCNALAEMHSELVNIRVHHGNGFINYCDSGVDLSQFQFHYV